MTAGIRLNLFTVIEKSEGITKTWLEETQAKLDASVTPDAETYVKLRIASDLMIQLAESVKEKLLESGFEKETYQGVEVSYRNGSTSKIFNDEVLDELDQEVKKIQARIKARKTYLTEMEDFESIVGKPTLTMKVPK